MKTESCRDWQESLGAFVLGHLSAEEWAGLEAHFEGCAECRAEADSLVLVARLLGHPDPDRIGPAPQPPAALGEQITAQIGAEWRRGRQRRRLRLGLALSGATAALAAAAIFVLPGSSGGAPTQQVAFGSLPPGVKISAVLSPRPFGTEISVYVNGIRSGTLCRVFLRTPGGASVSAGTFRYRWGRDSEAMLSSALDLSRVQTLVIHAGGRTFVAPVGATGSTRT